ncbi:hypothetical protein ADICYQ_5163 [Cyclobacterium qasimii M12-11B]|uniref:Uncharacterized protein n=1 Tax=Cyclobacterium qasimii M12-11B TaxID=641524 RepID=S7V6G8_9BACT|nr:hypothetical protein ADICYQ_5163 [Cyclobacterium qasimii M12-11B]
MNKAKLNFLLLLGAGFPGVSFFLNVFFLYVFAAMVLPFSAVGM